MNFRIERDLLGEREVPKEAYYGIHTLRAFENFPLSHIRVETRFIQAFAQVKKACAHTNYTLGFLEKNKAEAIFQACDEIVAGQWHEEMIVDPLQGGAGTSTNMNINEVIANRALELLGHPKGFYEVIHPLDHVNMHQSTNDVYPTALKIASLSLLQELSEDIAKLQGAFQAKEKQFSTVLKMARTELQDAVPMSMGSGFGAYAEAIARDRWRVFKSMERLKNVNLGGTAIGTGIGAPKKYLFLVVESLKEITNLPIARSENLIDATQNCDMFVEVSGILKAHATNLFKIASDLRLLSSGPRTGLAEIALPPVQAGSSIMVGKINPVICEAVNQSAMKVMGNDFLVCQAAQNGQLELNAFMPLLAHAFLESLTLLKNTVVMFREKAIEGITVHSHHTCANVLNSSGCLVALLDVLGYEKATQLALMLHVNHNVTLKELLEQETTLGKEQIDVLLEPSRLIALGR
ncbi:MAG: aspartate ammonia-lyase [Epsilonproteobacteria bacterium]|nr:aspartate ammonia-lyase [Campylobacterota bacterium]